jgi:hypothetical protein
VVAVKLKSPQCEQRDEIADMERVRGGIEARVERDRALGQALRQRIEVGAVGEEAAPA